MTSLSFTYTPPAELSTCKESYVFRLEREGDRLRIEELDITGSTGCLGHPRTLAALVKGSYIDELPAEELAEIMCANRTSCPRAFIKALEALKAEFKG